MDLIKSAIKWLTPIILVVISASYTSGWANGIANRKYNALVNSVKREYSHEITLEWWENNIDYVTVREDLAWTVDGASQNMNANLYTNTGLKVTYTPRIPTREGYRFLGFYETNGGGEQYVSASGYGLKTIKQDIKLYAMWERI